MPSLFRRLFTGHGVEESVGRALEEAAKVAVAELPVAETASESKEAEAPAAADVRQYTPDKHGLIPADQLPSATEALADLFPPEPPADPFAPEESGEPDTAALSDKGEGQAVDIESSPAEPPLEGHNANAEDTPQESQATQIIGASDSDPREAQSATTERDAAEPEAADAPAPAVTEVAASAEVPPSTELSPQPSATMEEIPEPPASANEITTELQHPQDPPDNSSVNADTSTSDRSEAAESEISQATTAPTSIPAPSNRDWKLDEKLAGHIEWLETHGQSGTRADLSDTNLEGQELIGVKLKLADLHDANLRAADLLLADLRDASLLRADLEDSCLVGANLEAANLEGASLETAMGLVPRQIAGANLHDALLPPHIMEFEAAGRFARASQIAWRCFAPLIPAILLSWLILWKTKDAQLLTDSAAIPFLHSPTAADALPTAQIFLLGPIVILALYLLFHFHLQKVWDAVLELPAVFPDGHPLDDRGPGIIVGLLRTHFWWINREGSSTLRVEKTISLLVAYWAVPFTLLLYWARYLTMQDLRGTLLQTLLVAIAVGVALHATTKTGRRAEDWTAERRWRARVAHRVREISPAVMASALGTALLLLSVGTLAGVPHQHSRAPQYNDASIRRWAADVFWAVGFDPYANLTEAVMSSKPPNWTGANAQVAAVTGPQMNGDKFRYAQAYGVFLANAHLWQSDFEGAYLSEADLRGADLGHSNLRFAILDGAMLSGANLNRARLNGAMLARADLRWANLSYASLSNAVLVDSQLDGATLYDARITSASLARASLKKADLRGSYLNAANLDHADLQQAYLWSAKLPGADLYGAKLQGAVAIDIDLRGADLREAQLSGTVLNDAKISGADLDRTDLRGALGLTAYQVCSSKSRHGALMDDALATQVTAECGGLQ